MIRYLVRHALKIPAVSQRRRVGVVIAGPITGEEMAAMARKMHDAPDLLHKAALDVDSARFHEEVEAATQSAVRAVVDALNDDGSNFVECVHAEIRTTLLMGMALSYHAIAERGDFVSNADGD